MRRTRGFTLAEILVSLALLAIVAAVVVPAVASSVIKGDAARVYQDLVNVQTGVSQFVADVHRYPLKYSDLSRAITAADSDINRVPYPAGMVSRWKGPYVSKDTINPLGVETGFGAYIKNRFAPFTVGSQTYFGIVAIGIAGPDFDQVDLQMDGAIGRTSGLLRWVTLASGDSTKFLAIPIQ